jgi:hypothetical protein
MELKVFSLGQGQSLHFPPATAKSTYSTQVRGWHFVMYVCTNKLLLLLNRWYWRDYLYRLPNAESFVVWHGFISYKTPKQVTGLKMFLKMRLSRHNFEIGLICRMCVGYRSNWANINTKDLKNILWNEHADTFIHSTFVRKFG